MDKRLLLYECLAEFKKQFYKDLILYENRSSGKINIKSLTYTNGATDDEANFWGWTFDKGPTKYLLPNKLIRNGAEEVITLDVLPIKPLKTTTVAHKGIAYEFIEQWASARFKSETNWTFKQFVDELSGLEHSNPKHYKLLWLIVLSQLYGRANIRVSTPPGFGKDSIIDIMRDLAGECASVQGPTLAKLQRLTAKKLVVINEVADLSKAEWNAIEKFLLEAGAGRTEIAKHSMGTDSSVKSDIDISDLSISLYYNSADYYPEPENFFDFVTKGAIHDRFVPVNLNGRYTEDFTKFKGLSVSEFVRDNMDEYRKLIYAYTHFKKTIPQHEPRWTRTDMPDFSPRWKNNITRFLAVVDAYAATQAEYTEYERILYESIGDYREMLDYVRQRIKINEKLDMKTLGELDVAVKQQKLFKDKSAVLRMHLKGETNYGEAQQHKFW